MLRPYKEHNEWAKLSHTITFHYNSLSTFAFKKSERSITLHATYMMGGSYERVSIKFLGILESRFGLFTLKNFPFNYNSMKGRAEVIYKYASDFVPELQ